METKKGRRRNRTARTPSRMRVVAGASGNSSYVEGVCPARTEAEMAAGVSTKLPPREKISKELFQSWLCGCGKKKKESKKNEKEDNEEEDQQETNKDKEEREKKKEKREEA